MKKKRQFTPQEDQYIIEHYSTCGFAEIASAIGRDYGSLQPRIAILVKRGLLDPRRRHYHPRWTVAEVERLELLWGVKSDKVVARLLGRSVVSCVLKAKRLGFNRKVNVLTLREVMEIFGLEGNHHKVRKWMTSGLLKARKSPYLQGQHNVWQVAAESLETFIKDHPGQYDRRRINREQFPFWRNLADSVPATLALKTHPRLYTPAEDRFIISHYWRMTVKEIATYLGRPSGGVSSRLGRLRKQNHLGVTKGRGWKRPNLHQDTAA